MLAHEPAEDNCGGDSCVGGEVGSMIIFVDFNDENEGLFRMLCIPSSFEAFSNVPSLK
jgi:hypothetical protein